MEEIRVRTDDNIEIAFNLTKQNNHENVLLICPGWFMTKDSKIFKEIASEFFGFIDTASMDFRGHGKSGGRYTFTSKEILDLKCVIEYLNTNYNKIFLLGFSLGAALSLLYTAEFGKINGIIAVSPPFDFDKIENRIWNFHAWYPTLFKKFEPARWISIRMGNLWGKKVKPADVIENIKCPIAFAAGENDPIVFPWHTRKLYEKTTAPKNFKLFKKGLHAEDLFTDNKEEFMKYCTNLLKQL